MTVSLPIKRINTAAEFGRVAVLMGGASSERQVSLRSGAAVLAALQAQDIDARAIDGADSDVLNQLRDGSFDRVFIILHGRGGEDGTIQGALDCLAIPYTGSGVLGSALGMDKLRCKQLWQGIGLPTPAYAVAANNIDYGSVLTDLGLPLIVKPAREGSSIGMSKVLESAQLREAVNTALSADESVLIEQWITGEEYTVAILDDVALPAIKLETPRDFYDYEAKYSANDTRYLCPCGLAKEDEAALKTLALKAFASVGACGWGRVDFMRDATGKFLLLEVNTVPGMTDHSLVPMAALEAGLSFEELVWRLLETSL